MAQDMFRDRGGNGQVTQAIKEHFDILEYIQSYGYHFKEKGGGAFQGIEHDSLWVTPAKNLFIWNSRGKGGSVIDFVMLEDGLTLPEAISKLRGEISGTETSYSPQKYANFKSTPRKPFEPPPAVSGRYSRLFAYLTKTRGISAKVVADMVKRKFLYEDAKYHNCVFVGRDYEGTAKFACVRSTGEKKFVRDLPGSSKKVGWFVNANKPSLFVCEAPIDALSVMSLLQIAGKNPDDYSFLAHGGNPSRELMKYHLENNPNIRTVYLCHDNDDPGRALAEKIRKQCAEAGFKGQIVLKQPLSNDFNDDLKHHVQQAAQQAIQPTANHQNLEVNSSCFIPSR